MHMQYDQVRFVIVVGLDRKAAQTPVVRYVRVFEMYEPFWITCTHSHTMLVVTIELCIHSLLKYPFNGLYRFFIVVA